MSRTSLLLHAAILRPALVVAIAGSGLAFPVAGQDKAVPAAMPPPAAENVPMLVPTSHTGTFDCFFR